MKFKRALNITGQKPAQWIIRTLFFSLFLSFVIGLAVYILGCNIQLSILLFLVSVVVLIIFSIWFLMYTAEQFMTEIDGYLPDYLDNVAGYIKAGFPPIIALKSALREEFGMLTRTLNFATIKSLGPTPAEDEILRATTELGSEKLQRVLTIFLTSCISGGHVGTMMERLAKDMRENNDLKKKLITGVNVYVTFISLSLIFILPLIVAVSLQFLSLNLLTMPANMQSSGIDMSGMVILGMILLSLTSLLTGMFIGVVRYGKELMGFKYSLTLLIFSNIAFAIYLFYIVPIFIGT